MPKYPRTPAIQNASTKADKLNVAGAAMYFTCDGCGTITHYDDLETRTLALRAFAYCPSCMAALKDGGRLFHLMGEA